MEYDIANLHFEDLPDVYQYSNLDAAHVACSFVEKGYAADAAQMKNVLQIQHFIERAAAAQHESWCAENEEWADPNQLVPYSELEDHEKEKTREIVRVAMHEVEAYIRTLIAQGGSLAREMPFDQFSHELCKFSQKMRDDGELADDADLLDIDFSSRGGRKSAGGGSRMHRRIQAMLQDAQSGGGTKLERAAKLRLMQQEANTVYYDVSTVEKAILTARFQRFCCTHGVMFFIYVLLFAVHALDAGKVTSRWTIAEGVKQLIVNAPFDDPANPKAHMTFMDIRNEDNFYAWVQDIVVEKLYLRGYLSINATANASTPVNETTMVPNTGLIVIGPPSFRQTRVQSQPCFETHSHLIGTLINAGKIKPGVICAGEVDYLPDIIFPPALWEDNEWLPHRTSYAPALDVLDPEGNTMVDGTGAREYWGTYGTYPGSGYVFDYPVDVEGMVGTVAGLKADEYIDMQTRAVFVDCTFYSTTHQLFISASFIAEINGKGRIEPHYHVMANSIFTIWSFENRWKQIVLLLLMVAALRDLGSTIGQGVIGRGLFWYLQRNKTEEHRRTLEPQLGIFLTCVGLFQSATMVYYFQYALRPATFVGQSAGPRFRGRRQYGRESETRALMDLIGGQPSQIYLIGVIAILFTVRVFSFTRRLCVPGLHAFVRALLRVSLRFAVNLAFPCALTIVFTLTMWNLYGPRLRAFRSVSQTAARLGILFYDATPGQEYGRLLRVASGATGYLFIIFFLYNRFWIQNVLLALVLRERERQKTPEAKAREAHFALTLWCEGELENGGVGLRRRCNDGYWRSWFWSRVRSNALLRRLLDSRKGSDDDAAYSDANKNAIYDTAAFAEWRRRNVSATRISRAEVEKWFREAGGGAGARGAWCNQCRRCDGGHRMPYYEFDEMRDTLDEATRIQEETETRRDTELLDADAKVETIDDLERVLRALHHWDVRVSKDTLEQLKTLGADIKATERTCRDGLL